MINFIQFTLTRAGLAVITLLLVCFIVFSLMELVPGTCAERYLAFKNYKSEKCFLDSLEGKTRDSCLPKKQAIDTEGEYIALIVR